MRGAKGRRPERRGREDSRDRNRIIDLSERTWQTRQKRSMPSIERFKRLAVSTFSLMQQDTSATARLRTLRCKRGTT